MGLILASCMAIVIAISSLIYFKIQDYKESKREREEAERASQS